MRKHCWCDFWPVVPAEAGFTHLPGGMSVFMRVHENRIQLEGPVTSVLHSVAAVTDSILQECGPCFHNGMSGIHKGIFRKLLSQFLRLCLSGLVLMAAAGRVSADDFDSAASVIVRRCLECHQAGNPSGDLVMSTHAQIMKGGESGPAVIAGSSAESLLLQRILSAEMPPAKRGIRQQLPEEEIGILKRWIDNGAKWPEGRQLDLFESTSEVRGGRDWWSLQPVVSPPVPLLQESRGNIHPIDAFVGVELKNHQLTPAPRADDRILIRRMYADIVGLPPGADVLDEISTRKNPKALEDLIDQLLASPHFGERWGRHWLDVARFAESCGYERDQPKPFAWKYRDWVVNAFNSDMPYTQFIREQLAGDELPDRTVQSVIATGFLRLGTWNDEPNDPQDYLYERLEDQVHATSSAFLGLTVKCARCHDHKFDPIPQMDYYRMASAFWAGPVQPRSSSLLGGPSPEELGMADVLGWTDITSSPPPLHLLKNGERHSPQQEVVPASLSFVPDQFRPFVKPSVSNVATTGRRRQLADWIASEKNPLAARVFVNRIWQHYFGEGLVRSPDNFGYTGEKPTHPELLDWLASEFIRGGWKQKPIHRLILTSGTWQQSSLHPLREKYVQVDAGNRWLWRANRRRLDAESMRDAMLASSGELDLHLGGPSFFPTVSEDALEGLSRKTAAWTASTPAEQRRRSLYIFSQRSLLPPLMTTFDMCDTTLPCGQRDVTIVAPQALTLLNNEFIHGRAEHLAEKQIAAAGATDDRVRGIWRAVLGRVPDARELAAAKLHLEKQLQRFESFQRTAAETVAEGAANPQDIPGVILHLSAEKGIHTDASGAVLTWTNQVAEEHLASQSDGGRRPRLAKSSINGRAAVLFDGRDDFLHLSGQLLKHSQCTIFVVGTDSGSDGHREILSNWNGAAGNAGTSVFLGLTGSDQIRFTDSFPAAGTIVTPRNPFLLTAVCGPHGVAVFQQQKKLNSLSQPFSDRRFDTAWVIGQQGNIGGEYWNGLLAEILVYDRELSPDERVQVTRHLTDRYALEHLPDDSKKNSASPETLAFASLALVLLNSNEFFYID